MISLPPSPPVLAWATHLRAHGLRAVPGEAIVASCGCVVVPDLAVPSAKLVAFVSHNGGLAEAEDLLHALRVLGDAFRVLVLHGDPTIDPTILLGVRDAEGTGFELGWTLDGAPHGMPSLRRPDGSAIAIGAPPPGSAEPGQRPERAVCGLHGPLVVPPAAAPGGMVHRQE